MVSQGNRKGRYILEGSFRQSFEQFYDLSCAHDFDCMLRHCLIMILFSCCCSDDSSPSKTINGHQRSGDERLVVIENDPYEAARGAHAIVLCTR